MITINPNRSIAASIIALLLGVVLIVWPGFVEKTIVTAIGSIILLIGGISLFLSLKSEFRPPLVIASEICAIVFGLSLIVFHEFFLSSIIIVLGITLIIIGVRKFSEIFYINKTNRLPFGYFISPIITIICGAIMFLNPFGTVRWMFIFFGISLIFYSISDLAAAIKVKNLIK